MLKRALLQMIDVFPKNMLEEGQRCYKQGSVLTIRLSDGLLKARVMGDANQIHDIYLDFKAWPTRPAVCGCAKKHNCLHAVACLLALEAKEKLDVLPAFQDKFYTKQPTQATYFPEKLISSEAVTWYSESHITRDSTDFFSYALGIIIDNKQISIVPWVISFMERFDLSSLEHLADDYLIKLPLGEGRFLELPFERLKPLIRLLLQYGIRSSNQADEELRLSRYQLLFMQEAEEAMATTAARWQGTDELRRMLTLLLSSTHQPNCAPPLRLQATLRDYQYEGFSWLHRLRMSRFGGVLADDMGLGKTIQTLALLQSEKEANRLNRASLIIAPTSVIGNWLQESKRFTPELRVLVYHGNDRHKDNFDDYDLVISTYGLVQRDKRRFVAYNFYYLILDEAHFIKNTRTKTRQVIQQFKATHRLCLTGTPLENHLGELWSLFHFLMPGLLGDRTQFRKFFRNPIEKHQDDERREILSRRIQPFLLRRTKNEVARELPPKTEMTNMIHLVDAQRDLYEAIRMTTEQEVRQAIAKQGLGKSHFILLDALLKLRQICCDPRLLSLPEASMAHHCSAKLDACMELLDNLMQEGRSVLVFSQFTSMLKLIEEKLVARRYPYLKLTGQTRDRQAVVSAFQEGQAPIFLISLKAGGIGLNLTQADTVIHYDPWWNPAVEDQATDRSHRIGQQRPVFVYRLITKGTVEEAMLTMQTKKRQLFQSLLSSDAVKNPLNFTEDDINLFFSPLE
jgi:superfamily II DNA or RNA helicase